MKNIYKQLVTTVLLATVGLPGTAMAESASGDGTAPLDVNLDFQIDIPGVLDFRVGAAGGIDLITFAPSAANLGDDSDIAGTGGDVTGGVRQIVTAVGEGSIAALSVFSDLASVD